MTDKNEYAKLVERAKNNLFEEKQKTQKKDISIIQKVPTFGIEGKKK